MSTVTRLNTPLMRKLDASDVPPQYVTITLSGADIARLPDGPAKDFLVARLVRQVKVVRRKADADLVQAESDLMVEQEMRRLEAAAQIRYVAMAAAIDAEYAARHRAVAS